MSNINVMSWNLQGLNINLKRIKCTNYLRRKMAEGARLGLLAADLNQRSNLWPRLKPTIYKTIDDHVIVEDEFLNFLAIKIKTMAQE